MNVDVVYTYVDGNDPNWLQKKTVNENTTNKIELNSNDSARYMDNEELKFSLRSIDKFASWINNIYIVTDNQVPAWLNFHNDKIKIIDHKDIFSDKACLPNFNAKAIETQIHHIPNLSERFIYFNDDMFLGRETKPEDFFDINGKPNIFVSELFPIPNKNAFNFESRNSSKKNDYQQSVINTRILFRDKFNKSIYYNIRHGVKPLLKSVLINLEEIFIEEVKKTSLNKFRSGDDLMMFHLCQFYCIYKKFGNPVYLKSIGNISKWKKLFSTTSKNNFAFINLDNDKLTDFLISVKKETPFVFCLNQTPTTTLPNLFLMRNFLKDYFPQKCSFEK